MVGKYEVLTLGCKANQYESQCLKDALRGAGLEPANRGETPDVAVVNTCAVTHMALRDSRQAVKRLARNGRTAVWVVGCGATAEPRPFADIGGVQGVLGHRVDISAELRRQVAAHLNGRPPQAGMASGSSWTVPCPRPSDEAPGDKDPSSDQRQPRSIPLPPTRRIVPLGLPDVNRRSASLAEKGPTVAQELPQKALLDRIDSFEGRQRALLKVQDGCDAHCTYCIIPHLRGGPRFKAMASVLEEARGLVRSGHQEIVLTGIFLGAYGRTTAVRKRWRIGGSGSRSPLSTLVESLARVEGLERLRLSSLEPGDVDDDLLSVMSSYPTCVPHLHLPLQSGSSTVLRRMNRQYSSEDFRRMIDRVKACLDRPAISTDVLVGFPGETDDDFRQTLDVVEQAEFVHIHAFPYSPRPGTAANRWGREFVPRGLVRERMTAIGEMGRLTSLRFRQRAIGHVERIIVESLSDASGSGRGERIHPPGGGSGGVGVEDGNESALWWTALGRSDRYFSVSFPVGGLTRVGAVVSVLVDSVTTNDVRGVPIHEQFRASSRREFVIDG